MNILIHACPERMWYINEFLLPELTRQGVRNVDVYNDVERLGNLQAFLDSVWTRCRAGEDTWHLQDDVWPCSDFGAKIEALAGREGVVCGFVNEIGGPDANLVGEQCAADLWYSFPCIRIPGQWARQLAAWVRAGADGGSDAARFLAKNQGDDWFFQRFLALYHADAPVYHCKPCLVEHVDFLLGGSQVSPWRGYWARAAYWDESEQIEKLTHAISTRKTRV